MATDTTTAPETTDTKPQAKAVPRKKLWLCVRMVDYRLQALAPADPDDQQGEQEWADLGPDSLVSADREAVYQLARMHQGLLMAAAGLPSAGRLAQLAAKIKEQEVA